MYYLEMSGKAMGLPRISSRLFWWEDKFHWEELEGLRGNPQLRFCLWHDPCLFNILDVITNTYGALTCAGYHARHFSCMSIFNPLNKSERKRLFNYAFYRSAERLPFLSNSELMFRKEPSFSESQPHILPSQPEVRVYHVTISCEISHNNFSLTENKICCWYVYLY